MRKLLLLLNFFLISFSSFAQAPVISSFDPVTATAGTTVAISGTDFSDVTSVSFGGIPASSFTVNSSTSITAIVASGGSGEVAVTAAGGTAILAGFTYTDVVTLTKAADGAEPATNARFTVGFPAGVMSSAETTVTYTVGGSADSGSDYAALSGTVTIPPNTPAVDIEIDVIADQLIEGNETVELTLDGASNELATLTVNTGTVSAGIVDDNSTSVMISLTKAADGAEPATNARFTVGFPAGVTSSAETIVNYTIDGTAANGTDYTTIPNSITIPSGSSFANIDIVLIDDRVIESLETVELTLTSANTGSMELTVTPSGAVAADITDDDNTSTNNTVSLTKLSDGGEGGTGPQFMVSFPGGITRAQPTTILYTIGGEAANSIDFTTLPGSVLIPAGSNSAVIDISVINDQVIEGTETVELTLSTETIGVSVSPGGPVPANITDDDDTPSNRSISLAKIQDGAESTANVIFRMQFPPGIANSVDTTLNYILGGSAIPGVDFSDPSGSVTIPAGDNSVDIIVEMIDEQLMEATETVTLALQSAPEVLVSANIVDDDNTPVNNRLNLVKEEDGLESSANAKFRISYPPGISSSLNTIVKYDVGGSGTAGADYISFPDSVVIPAGANSVDIDVVLINDQQIEDAETLEIAMLSAQNVLAEQSVSTTPVAASLSDDDNTTANNLITLTSLSDASEPALNSRFTVSFPPGISSSVPTVVNYRYADSITATPGADFTSLPGSVIIPAGQNSANIDVAILNDQVIEGNETIALTLTSVNNGLWSMTHSPEVVTANIGDDDNASANTITLTRVADGGEAGSNARFLVSFPPGITSILQTTVNYTTGGTATEGEDYSPLSGAVVIPAGVNSAVIDVTVNNDQIIEGDEAVALNLVSATNLLSAMTVSPGTPVMATISDDDNSAANSVVTLTKIADGAEPETNVGFNVSFPSGITSSVPTVVKYVRGGTAINGTDYSALPDSVIIPPGANSANIEVSVLDDQMIEISETVTLTLSSAHNNVSPMAVLPVTSVIANITDDESVAPNTIILTKVSDGAEPDSHAKFRVMFPVGITSSVTTVVNYTVSGTAINGMDYRTLSGTAIIPAGANSADIDVILIDDQLIERPEAVELTLMSVSNSLIALTMSPVTPVIAHLADNDIPTITSISPLSGEIGATVMITGSHFSSNPANNIVYFGAVKAPVSAASSTSLTVSVPAGASFSRVTVTCDSLTAYSNEFFNVTFPNEGGVSSATFSNTFDYSSPGFPVNAGMSDSDGDGRADIFVANSAINTISVLKNDGSGTGISFASKADLTTGPSPGNIMLTDFDGDGKQDIAVPNFNSGNAGSVSLFRNNSANGNVSFSTKIDYSTGNGSTAVSSGDLDGDGKPDMIVSSGNSGAFSIFRNSSMNGEISFEPKIDIAATGHPENIFVNDFDGDGKPDLAIPNFSANTVSIYRNNSTGSLISFDSAVDFSTEVNPTGVAVADFDGDGKNDLVVLNSGSNSLSAFKNNSDKGNISFLRQATYKTGSGPSGPATGDLNGDGKPDLAVANFSSNTVSIFMNSSGSDSVAFTQPIDVPTASMPNDVLIADANNDGLPDLIVPSGAGIVSVFKNTASGPSITGVSAAIVCPGSVVTITGANLGGATVVMFGGTPAASFSVVSSTTIRAVAGSGTSGNVEVITPGGTATFQGMTITPVPAIIADGSTTFAPGGTVLLSASTGNGYIYRWRRDGTVIDGATSQNYTATQSGSYSVEIVISDCSTVSEPTLVNVVFGLPPTNFKISSTSETCRTSNNGSIAIAAVQTLNYTATLSGQGINLSNNFTSSTEFTGLSAGSYRVCITVVGQTGYEQCYDMVVTEPRDLAVYTSVDKTAKSVSLDLEGGSVYKVELNGKIFNTTGQQITLPLLPGNNWLRVSTDKVCQGVVEKIITVSPDVLVYPNPFEDKLNIGLDTRSVQKAGVEIRNLQGKLVYSGQHTSDLRGIQLDLPEMVKGVYLLKLSFNGTETIYKIMRK
ncbi:MAG TPA: Calx-beta domain-containing protein [Sphingobacteriaceae bacterium]